MGVALFHFHAAWPGYLAVDFFFVLSGFILYLNYFATAVPNPGTFISHRIARLYPMHLFSLLLFAMILWLTAGFPHYQDGTAFTFIQQMVLLQNLGIDHGGLTWNYPNWSVAVELWMNLIFLFFFARQGSAGRFFFLGMLGIVLIISKSRNLNVTTQDYFGFLNAGLIRGLSGFFLGIAAFRLYRLLQQPHLSARLAFGLQLGTILMALAVICLRNGTTSPTDFFAPFIFLAMVSTFALEQGWLALLAARLSYLGRISYSVYLNQLGVLTLVHHTLKPAQSSGLLALALYLGILIAFSSLTYYLVEVPARRGLRHFFTRLQPSLRDSTQS